MFKKSGTVVLNMLRAHTSAYKAIKALPGGQDVQIGYVHQHMRFEPKADGALSAMYTR